MAKDPEVLQLVGLIERLLEVPGIASRVPGDLLTAIRTSVDRTKKEEKIQELKARGTPAHNFCSDHRDKQRGRLCLACHVEELELRLRRAGIDHELHLTPEELQRWH